MRETGDIKKAVILLKKLLKLGIKPTDNDEWKRVPVKTKMEAIRIVKI